MYIPICQKCHTEWTWLETIKNIFKLNCPHCEEKQYQSASSKKKSMTINAVFIVTVFFLNVLFNFKLGLTILIGILMLVLLISTLPFYLRLANEEEYWF